MDGVPVGVYLPRSPYHVQSKLVLEDPLAGLGCEATTTERAEGGTLEITVRNLMNQEEEFIVEYRDTVVQLARRYARRTGLRPRGLRFKIPDGDILVVDTVDEDLTLYDVRLFSKMLQ